MRTLNRFAPGFKRIMVAVLAIAMLVSSVSFSKGTNAKAAASTIGSAEDYSVTATDVSDSLCRITFTPTNPAAYVIIHYKVNDGEQVNVGMNAKGSCFEYDINNVKKGDKIDCSFTYNKGGLQYDSSMMTYTTGSAPVTDTSIEAPFGLVVASPANGEISVVWGRGNVDSYNVYIDNALVGSKLGCGYYVYKGYAVGTHTVKVTTVSGNKESAAATASVNVIAPTTKAPETTTKAPQTTKAPETTKSQQTDNNNTITTDAKNTTTAGNSEGINGTSAEKTALGRAAFSKKIKKKLSLKKIKVSIKKVENATGYEVRVATSKKFKKTLYKKSYKKVAFTLKSKKLANKKKLYIKVRAYVLDGTNKIYGKWSKVKKVKIK